MRFIKLFCKLLTDNCAAIEQRNFNIGDVQVKFTFDLFPSDMKLLAFVNGELSNSASYFSSFANAKSDDLKGTGCLKGEFWTDPKYEWKPWAYKDIVTNAKKVCAFKKNCPRSFQIKLKEVRLLNKFLV